MSDVIGNIASANLDGAVTPKASVNGSLYPKGEKGDPGNGISSIVKTGSVGKVDTYTITFDDETTTTFNVTNGEDGINGVDGSDGKSLEFNWRGTQLGIRVEGSQEYTYVDLKGADGQDGHTPVKGTDYFTPSEIADIESDIISQIDTLKKQIVQTLPVTDIDPNTIYLVPKQSAAQGDIYDEWIYINNAWEHIGSTQVDLTDYYNKTQTDTLLAAKQDNLVSGTNIKTINNQSVLGNGNIDIEGNEVYISDDDTDIPASTKIFINESEGTDAYSEVVNSLAGDEIAKAPSVHAVNNALDNKVVDSLAGNETAKAPSVRAVNNALLTENVAIENVFELQSGFSFFNNGCYCFKQGNHYFGVAFVKNNNGNFSGSSETIIAVPKKTITKIANNNSGFIYTGEYQPANGFAYVWISSNVRVVGSNGNYVKFNFDFLASD